MVGTIVAVESALTDHSHVKFILCITVPSWSCTFFGFGQMYNDICPLL